MQGNTLVMEMDNMEKVVPLSVSAHKVQVNAKERGGTRFEADEEMCGDDEDRDALQETIKNMQAITGARIQVISLHPPPGDTSTERAVQIDGSSEQIEAAKQLVNEVISKGLRTRILCLVADIVVSMIQWVLG
uniref:K Homology domain-containing protein n=1 Tax=Lactuca sativa TaxID=4236 RepID=A0A9R1W7Z7_LACSA|nr:hypothetical protein LSAT_V11C200100270 [Lactuca sativa]